MYISAVRIENFRCFGKPTVFQFNPGVTVLVGENDSGKTAVIDAIRYVLGTTDQSWQRVEITDYHDENLQNEIHISIKFRGLTTEEKASFMECLTYTTKDEILILNWTAKYLTNVRPNRTLVSLSCGKDGDVAPPSAEARELLRVTYLRPLRDAYAQMRAGRNSRLAQILSSIKDLNNGKDTYIEGMDVGELSLSGIFDLSNHLLANHGKIKSVNKNINAILNEQLMLNNDSVNTEITVSGSGNTEEKKMYSLLEKLDLSVSNQANQNYGNVGLGTSNMMSMACEMLLNKEDRNSTFMLIEEPEAHIHAQRQLKLIQSMQKNQGGQQIILTTHSPLLASVVELDNLVMIQNHKAFSMSKGKTCLQDEDYKFLERYLDATKANLFFAKGVLIVEGPGEALLLPTLARLMKRDLTDYGISIVDVKSTGLRRYAKIFQRAEGEQIKIPVACVTDRDVMPDCAPAICINKKYSDSDKWPESRRWKTESEIEDVAEYERNIREKADGQNVKTFIPEQWTLEYELAANGLGKIMLKTIAKLRSLELKTKTEADLIKEYGQVFDRYQTIPEQASYVYSFFGKKLVSKAEFAQQFAYDLEELYKGKKEGDIEDVLPPYLVDAIKYVTTSL